MGVCFGISLLNEVFFFSKKIKTKKGRTRLLFGKYCWVVFILLLKKAYIYSM